MSMSSSACKGCPVLPSHGPCPNDGDICYQTGGLLGFTQQQGGLADSHADRLTVTHGQWLQSAYWGAGPWMLCAGGSLRQFTTSASSASCPSLQTVLPRQNLLLCKAKGRWRHKPPQMQPTTTTGSAKEMAGCRRRRWAYSLVCVLFTSC